jgi:hypothetical protein
LPVHILRFRASTTVSANVLYTALLRSVDSMNFSESTRAMSTNTPEEIP